MEYELMFGWKIEPTDFSLSFFFPFFFFVCLFGKLGEIYGLDITLCSFFFFPAV